MYTIYIPYTTKGGEDINVCADVCNANKKTFKNLSNRSHIYPNLKKDQEAWN